MDGGILQGVSDGDHIQVAVEGEDAQGKGLVAWVGWVGWAGWVGWVGSD